MDQLQSFLSSYFAEDVKHVYIKPPANSGMEYPCVLIARATGNTAFADNNPYRHQPRYTLTGISLDPDSGLYELLAALPRCIHERSFPADNLNHDVFTIFFEEEAE
jgi:hypothetical protein